MTSADPTAALQDRLVAVRRELHASAEVGLHLPATQAIVTRELTVLGLDVTLGDGLSSVTAVLTGSLPGPTVLLRSDMDALPIVETTGLPFAAPGDAMHACGHDLHMAGLLGTARLLSERRSRLRGKVVFMFQPGEEGFAGGRMMIEEGVLSATGEHPVAAFAVHVDSMTDPGRFVTRTGPIMAGVSAAYLTVRGRSGHAAMPHHSIDPIPVAAEIVLAIQSFVARRIPAMDPAVISVTRISSDSDAGNVLSGAVELEANIRTFSRETLALVRDGLPALLAGIATAHGCDLDVRFVDSYPVTVNDSAETRFVLDTLDELHGESSVERLEQPSTASEDFAYVLERAPGTLVFLGVGVDGARSPMHSAEAVFDDSLLSVHATALAELAERRLAIEAKDGHESDRAAPAADP